MVLKKFAGMRRVSQNVIPCEKFAPQLHTALSDENLTLGTTVCSLCHPEQHCLSRRRGFASPKSAHSSLLFVIIIIIIINVEIMFAHSYQ